MGMGRGKPLPGDWGIKGLETTVASACKDREKGGVFQGRSQGLFKPLHVGASDPGTP